MMTRPVASLNPELTARVDAYARAAGLSVPIAVAQLLEYALDMKAARQAGGRSRMASLSPDERKAFAQAGVQARQKQP